MTLAIDFLYCFFPSALAFLFLPALRKKPLLIFEILLLPTIYFLLCALGQLGTNYGPAKIKFLVISILLLGLFTAIKSLVLKRMIDRILYISAALIALITASSFTALGEVGTLLSGAVGLLMGTTTMTIGLMADIEDQWGQPLMEGCGGGVSFLFPRHSGLILTAILLFGSIPGSLLFLVEDVMLHEISTLSKSGCGLVLLVTGLASISAYRVFTQTFCGRTLYDLPVFLRKEPSRWLRAVLLLFLILGLSPNFFLRFLQTLFLST